MTVKLNLGCGPVQPSDWVNIDGSNRAKIAHYLPWLDSLLVRVGVFAPTEFGPHVMIVNLTKPLPFERDSVDYIYAGELLEHLLPDQAENLMGECQRCLKPRGVLRVCVPDMLTFWKNYVNGVERELSVPAGRQSDSHSNHYMKMFFDEICVKRPWFGSMGQYHKWGYDEVSLVALFKRAGFPDARRHRFHDSAIPDVKKVERSNFLIVEGRKAE